MEGGGRESSNLVYIASRYDKYVGRQAVFLPSVATLPLSGQAAFPCLF